MRERRHYSDELKAEAVRMVIREGLSQPEAATRLGIPKATLGNWIMAFKNSGPKVAEGTPSLAEVVAENTRLRKELADSRMREEILKKAAAYFAKESLPGMRS
jgi:transposase